MNNTDNNDKQNNHEEFNIHEAFKEMLDDVDADFNFIMKLEGGKNNTAEAFIGPSKKSGLTLAGGVDFGQMDHAEAKKTTHGIPGFYEKVEDYIGMTGDEIKALEGEIAKIKFTKEEIIHATEIKYRGIFKAIEEKYDATNGKGSFDSLPRAVKTTIFSVGSQYGPALDKETPKFWTHAGNKDYRSMVNELNNFGDDFERRRKIEADYLENTLIY